MIACCTVINCQAELIKNCVNKSEKSGNERLIVKWKGFESAALEVNKKTSLEKFANNRAVKLIIEHAVAMIRLMD